MTWLGEYSALYGMRIWAYCLMTNHVHIIAAGLKPDSLSKAIGRTHMRFARWINRQNGWSGHLWSNRFFSTPLDELHLWGAVKYVELNPVRAGVVEQASAYPWSSAMAHCAKKQDVLLDASRPFPGPIGDWSAWLDLGVDDDLVKRIREKTSSGRPCGSHDFVRDMERKLNRILSPARRGPHPSSGKNNLSPKLG
jgi:putative transposase